MLELQKIAEKVIELIERGGEKLKPSELSERVVSLLEDRNILYMLPTLLIEINRKIEKKKERSTVYVVTSHAGLLSKEEAREIVGAPKDARVLVEVDPVKTIGGSIVNFKDKKVSVSIRSQINSLENKIA